MIHDNLNSIHYNYIHPNYRKLNSDNLIKFSRL